MTLPNRAKTAAALLAAALAATGPAAGEDFWDVSVIDNTGATGEGASLKILPSGEPAVSFFRFSDFSLQYAVWNGSVWQSETVDTNLGLAGGHTSLAFLPSGEPAISYYDGTIRDLKYAAFDGSQWQVETVDGLGRVGTYNSLAILPSGQPGICYFDATNGDLKYAAFDGAQWQITTVDDVGVVGEYASLALQPSGDSAISYHDGTNGTLKYAWFDGAAWQNAVVDSSGFDAGKHTSLAFLPSGNPAIAYQARPAGPPDDNTVLRFASRPSGWVFEDVDTGPGESVGAFASLAIMPDGEPAISCFDATHGRLMLTRRSGTVWTPQIVDAGGEVGGHCSLAVLPSGRAAVAYRDATNADLLYAAPPDLDAPPVSLGPSFTATAWTELGGDTVVVNGPAYNLGVWPVGIEFAFATSSVSFTPTEEGHLRGSVAIMGKDGFDFGDLTSCEDAGGTIEATINVGVSASHPLGSALQGALDLIVRGDPGDMEGYLLTLSRGAIVLAQISPAAPAGQTVDLFAGETLTLDLITEEVDSAGDGEAYDRFFECRFVLLGEGSVPGDINGDGVVDVLDLLEVLGAWGPCPGCPSDLNGDGVVNVLDLLIVLAEWT